MKKFPISLRVEVTRFLSDNGKTDYYEVNEIDNDDNKYDDYYHRMWMRGQSMRQRVFCLWHPCDVPGRIKKRLGFDGENDETKVYDITVMVNTVNDCKHIKAKNITYILQFS
jgi:hypothetical protein